MKYEVEVISPLHVGSGEEISPLEYTVDEKFYRIDSDSLFKDEKFDIDGFVDDIKLGLIDIEKYKDLAKKHIKYAIEISNSARKNIKRKDVLEFIKTGGRIYVPGSSIKGAIRTAFLWYILKKKKELYEKMKEDLEKILTRERKPDKKYVDDEIEKKVFGKEPQYDIFKAIQISDGNILPTDRLKIEMVKVLSTTSYGYTWKNFLLFLETLKVGTKFEIDIKIDEYLTEENIARKLEFNDKIECLKNIEEICKKYSMQLIDYEIDFFEKYKRNDELNEIINFYKNLKKKDDLLLRLSWGAGWHSMTIGRMLQEDRDIDFLGLRKLYNLGKFSVQEFPKTRRIVFDDKPKYPLGWIKLKVKK
ncbi:MAG: type III-A CRISPR-associated RAMP protein Csm5 [Candidatus Thermoplasmatota archaeon]